MFGVHGNVFCVLFVCGCVTPRASVFAWFGVLLVQVCYTLAKKKRSYFSFALLALSRAASFSAAASLIKPFRVMPSSAAASSMRETSCFSRETLNKRLFSSRWLGAMLQFRGYEHRIARCVAPVKPKLQNIFHSLSRSLHNRSQNKQLTNSKFFSENAKKGRGVCNQ